jgi:PKHD-type hydroxylase
MLVHIPALFAADQIASIRARLDAAPWVDGRLTAGPQSAQVKSNQQVSQEEPIARALGEEVLRALGANARFISAALPRHVYPPLFNRYMAGMGFGAHIDNAVRQIPGTSRRLRTDLSATLFLSTPEEYDGGELVIEDTYGSHAVKHAAGDLVVYSAGSVHQVLTVTRGTRVAAFFWIQSMVRDDADRALLFDLDNGVRELAQGGRTPSALLQLTACYHNLLRRWGDV